MCYSIILHSNKIWKSFKIQLNGTGPKRRSIPRSSQQPSPQLSFFLPNSVWPNMSTTEFQVRPTYNERFPTSIVKELLRDILKQELTTIEYTVDGTPGKVSFIIVVQTIRRCHSIVHVSSVPFLHVFLFHPCLSNIFHSKHAKKNKKKLTITRNLLFFFLNFFFFFFFF